MSSLVPRERQGSAKVSTRACTGGTVLLAGIWARLAWHSTGRLPLLLSSSVPAVLAATLLVCELRGNNTSPVPEPPAHRQEQTRARR